MKIKVVISESDELESPSRLTKEIVGTYEEIILPLYRELKKFWSQSFDRPHWEKLNAKRINRFNKEKPILAR